MNSIDKEQLTQQIELKGSHLRYYYERGEVQGYDVKETLDIIKEAQQKGISTIEAKLLLEDIELQLEFI